MRRREESMEEQNRVNREKDINTQKQETEVVTGREKVGKGAIRKLVTQGEIATNPKGEKHSKKRGTKKND